MSHLRIATGPGIRHWTDGPFSFRMTRDAGFRFLNGPFTMIGLTPVDPARDGFMLCGSPAILTDPVASLAAQGFAEGSRAKARQYVIDEAFVERPRFCVLYVGRKWR